MGKLDGILRLTNHLKENGRPDSNTPAPDIRGSALGQREDLTETSDGSNIGSMEYELIQAGTAAGPSTHRSVVTSLDWGHRLTRSGGQGGGHAFKIEASSSKGAKKPRGNGSPFVTGGGTMNSRRPDLEANLVRDQKIAAQSREQAGGQKEPRFPHMPTGAFYGTEGARGRMLDRPHRSRSPVSYDRYGDIFDDETKGATGSRPRTRPKTSPGVPNILDRVPMIRKSQDKKKGKGSRGDGDNHTPADETSQSDRSTSPRKRGLAKNNYVEISDDEDNDTSKSTAKAAEEHQRRGVWKTDPEVKAIGLTRGEQTALAKGRGRSTAAATGKRDRPVDRSNYVEKPVIPRSTMVSSKLKNGPAKILSADVQYAYLECEMDGEVDLRAESLDLDEKDGICSFVGPDNRIFDLPIRCMRVDFQLSDSRNVPYVQMSIAREACGRELIENLESSFSEVPGLSFYAFKFILVPGLQARKLLKSAVDIAKKHNIAIATMPEIAVESIKRSLKVYSKHDGNYLPDVRESRWKARSAKTRAGHSADVPISAISGLSDRMPPSEPASKKRKTLPKPLINDPNQSTLNSFQTVPKIQPDKKEKARSTNKDDPIHITSPERKPKKDTSGQATRASKRLSGKGITKTYLEGDSDGEIQATDPVVKAPTYPRPENWNGVLFPYPLQGRADINITEGDRWRVESGDFLNDTLIEFGLKHVLSMIRNLVNCSIDIDKDVHLFNSFFYEKLSSGTKPTGGVEEKWAAYESVKKWTKGKDIFTKKLLIIPINENAHWYFAIIYNPSGIMRPIVEPVAVEPTPFFEEVDVKPHIRNKSDDDDTAAVESAIPLGTTDSSSPRTAAIPDLAGPAANTAKDDEVLSDIDTSSRPTSRRGGITARISDDGNETSSGSVRASSPDRHHVGDDSADPIDSIDRSPVKSALSISKHFIPRALNKSKWNRSQSLSTGNPPPAPPVMSVELLDEIAAVAPQPIDNPTLRAFRDQDLQVFAEAAVGDQEKADVQPDSLKDEEPASAPSAKVKKGKDPARILEGDEAWVMTFDSLGGGHPAVNSNLQKWLIYEANDKLPDTYTLVPGKYREARVPQQPNFSDCGLYLIHYVWQILKNYEEAIRFIELNYVGGSGAPRASYVSHMNQVFGEADTGGLRPVWTGKIDELKKEFDKLRGVTDPTPGEKIKDGVDDQDGDDGIQIQNQPTAAIDPIPPIPEEKTVDPIVEDPGPQGGEDVVMGEEEDGLTNGVNHIALDEQGYEDDVEMEDPEQAGRLKLDKGKGKAVDPTYLSPRQSLSPYFVSADQNQRSRKLSPKPLVDYLSSTTPREVTPNSPNGQTPEAAQAGDLESSSSKPVSCVDPQLLSGVDPVLLRLDRPDAGASSQPELPPISLISANPVGAIGELESVPASQSRARNLSQTMSPPPSSSRISPPNRLKSSGEYLPLASSNPLTSSRKQDQRSQVSDLTSESDDESELLMAEPLKLVGSLSSGSAASHSVDMGGSEPDETVEEDETKTTSRVRAELEEDKPKQFREEQDELDEDGGYVQSKENIDPSLQLDGEQDYEIVGEGKESEAVSAQENMPPLALAGYSDTQSEVRRESKTEYGGVTAGRKSRFAAPTTRPLHHPSIDGVPSPYRKQNTSLSQPKDTSTYTNPGFPNHHHPQPESHPSSSTEGHALDDLSLVPSQGHHRFTSPIKEATNTVSRSSPAKQPPSSPPPPTQVHPDGQADPTPDSTISDSLSDSMSLLDDEEEKPDSPVMVDGKSKRGGPLPPDPTPQTHSPYPGRSGGSPEVVIAASVFESHPLDDPHRPPPKRASRGHRRGDQASKSGTSSEQATSAGNHTPPFSTLAPSLQPPSPSKSAKAAKAVTISHASRRSDAESISSDSSSSEAKSPPGLDIPVFGSLMGPSGKEYQAVSKKIVTKWREDKNNLGRPAASTVIVELDAPALTGKKRSHSGNGEKRREQGSSAATEEISGGRKKKARKTQSEEGRGKPNGKRQSGVARDDEDPWIPGEPSKNAVKGKNDQISPGSASKALLKRVASPVVTSTPPNIRPQRTVKKAETPRMESGEGNSIDAPIAIDEDT